MELTQLYYFYKVAELEHITKAANEINIAQPALTKSIHRLESELDVKLFCHVGRNIQLTSWGKWLYNRIKEPLHSLSLIKNEIEDIKNNDHIKICATVASILITDAILEFKKKYPNVTFSLTQNVSLDYDIFVSTAESGYEEKILLGCGDKYKNKINEIKDIEKFPVITFTSFKEFRGTINALLKKMNIKLNVAFECDNVNSIHDLIKDNNGIGFIPEFTWGNLKNDLNLISLKGNSMKRYISVKKNSYSMNNEVINEKFYSYLKKCFEEKKIIKL